MESSQEKRTRKRARAPEAAAATQEDEVEGFAMLVGVTLDEPLAPEKFSRVITQPWPVTLGRHSDAPPPSFVDLGRSKYLSRNAAVMGYNTDSGSYTLSSIGKNKVWVNKLLVDEGATVGLGWGDAVRVGRSCFYFMPPRLERPKASYLELAVECLSREGGRRTTRQIAMWLVSTYPYFNLKNGNTPGLVSLTRSVAQGVSKSERFVQTKEGRAILYSLAQAKDAAAPW